MKALVCVDGRGWEPVVRGAARYLSGGWEAAVLAHALDGRVVQGYDLALRGLMGRRRGSDEGVVRASREAAGALLADAEALLERLRPGLAVETVVLDGPPNEALVRAARGAQAVFVGRGTPGDAPRVAVSGVVGGWRRNPRGEVDGLLLEDGTEVRFPPHRAGEVRAVVREGARVEASGVWRGRHLHAYHISEEGSGVSVSAHDEPGEGGRRPGKSQRQPLGHTARFVVDHVAGDVVVVSSG